MTETFYRTGNCKVDHSTFGGDLSLFDFEDHRTLENMARKIASEWDFDKRCRKNKENITNNPKKGKIKNA